MIADSGGKPPFLRRGEPHSPTNVNRKVHIRAASFVDAAGVAAISNCIEYTLEMGEEAITV